jgi:hypothetical protein
LSLNPLEKLPSLLGWLPNLRFIILDEDQKERFSKELRAQDIIPYQGIVMMPK